MSSWQRKYQNLCGCVLTLWRNVHLKPEDKF